MVYTLKVIERSQNGNHRYIERPDSNSFLIRRRLGIKEGTRIKIEENGKEIILKPITREYVHSLRGKFKGKGLLKALMAEKKKEREL